jgi:hypothetical protein
MQKKKKTPLLSVVRTSMTLKIANPTNEHYNKQEKPRKLANGPLKNKPICYN